MYVRSISKEITKRMYNPFGHIIMMMSLKNKTTNEILNGKRYIVSYTKVHMTHYLEDYYTNPEIATNMISPMSEYIWWSWLLLQGVIVFGTLFHSNYYFTGKALPKVQGNSQLCEDSW
ncbi:conserved Plasmodium protein, unknown function [Plasmodium sp. gorilla clade G2]|uniref:conserved Plasmodium protein, unknown function n=1 Tax=Plasmodium sp. gorilla clade G2 TaxID=880535 RepID=UPI000D213CE5|nr:conserved Plasmodium protein, unknown function [Plasmodium sp. gorilla clade G2]SOV15099.1 conserved Plasmodium protein, unknown function [Plasmodium sp. gorilla clade G2]